MKLTLALSLVLLSGCLEASQEPPGSPRGAVDPEPSPEEWRQQGSLPVGLHALGTGYAGETGPVDWKPPPGYVNGTFRLAWASATGELTVAFLSGPRTVHEEAATASPLVLTFQANDTRLQGVDGFHVRAREGITLQASWEATSVFYR